MLAVLAASTACNVGPKYRTPAAPAPPAFTEPPPQAFTESKEWKAGSPADAFAKGKEGITLELDTELKQCGLPVPANLSEIEQWVRTARGV